MATASTDETLEALIDMTLADTFPASDPPCWTLGREPHPRSQITAPTMKAGQAHVLTGQDRR
ncbi:MAG TPA: hypothetical protein VNN62_16800 [Methylomirabilota bacterium]|jgi:hypothetical protein|nr:hypothetical protein [Methylomirabilota bacterium]